MPTTSPARPGLVTDSSQAEPARTLPNGAVQWICRSATFVVVMSRVAAGTVLERKAGDQPDEYIVLLPQGMGASVAAEGAVIDSEGDALLIVPPGDSTVTAAADGWVYQVFSHHAADLCAVAEHQDVYGPGVPDVRALETWPEPVGGYKLRHYRLADHARQDNPMRLFRTRHLMVNVFTPSKAPRDIRKMTPHSHADFEQGSLAVQGNWVHHLRYPWIPDMTQWHEDEHLAVGSPSVMVITPNVIHTSQSVGTPPLQLVDIFAPPRDDFSLKPGLVCNADEYPLPDRLKDQAAAAVAA